MGLGMGLRVRLGMRVRLRLRMVLRRRRGMGMIGRGRERSRGGGERELGVCVQLAYRSQKLLNGSRCGRGKGLLSFIVFVKSGRSASAVPRMVVFVVIMLVASHFLSWRFVLFSLFPSPLLFSLFSCIFLVFIGNWRLISSCSHSSLSIYVQIQIFFPHRPSVSSFLLSNIYTNVSPFPFPLPLPSWSEGETRKELLRRRRRKEKIGNSCRRMGEGRENEPRRKGKAKSFTLYVKTL